MKENRRAKETFYFIVILSLSLALRIYGLGLNSYWIDELVSVHFATRPTWNAIFWDNNPFLYHLLLKLWIMGFGDSERATRSMSVLFSVGTTAVLFRLGLKVGGFTCACLMGGLHAISNLSIVYAQETRMYAMFEFATALSMNFFFEITKNRRGYRGFLATTPLLCLSSYLSIVPLGMETAWLFLKSAKKKIIIIWSAALGLVLATVSYLIRFSWHQLEWQKYKFEAEANSHWPRELFWTLLNKSWLTSGGDALLLLLFFWMWRKFPKKRPPLLTASFFFAIIPIAAFQIESIVEHRSVFLPRYFIYLVPYLVIWSSLVLTMCFESRTRAVRYLGAFALACILTGTAAVTPDIYLIHKSPWNKAADFISKYPASFGLTTRTAAVKTPYFERYGIDVEKWDPGTEKVDYVFEKTKKYQNVWMIENFYGGKQYFERLSLRMAEKGLRTEVQVISAGVAEPVLLMRIF